MGRILLALILLASTLVFARGKEEDIRQGSVLVIPLNGEVT